MRMYNELCVSMHHRAPILKLHNYVDTLLITYILHVNIITLLKLLAILEQYFLLRGGDHVPKYPSIYCISKLATTRMI